MQIKVEIHDDAVRKGLDELVRRGANLRPLMQDIGEETYRSVQKNFDVGGRPSPWKTSARVRRDGGKTLSDTARLRRSIAVDADNRSVRVGTNVIYAAIHQLGGKIHHKERILAFKKRGGFLSKKAARKRKTAIRIAVSSAHDTTIPARPFLALTDDDMRRIERIAADYLGKQ